MSNLVPEPRQDKNGKIVIRHVKPDTGNAAGGIPIPAPQPVAKPNEFAHKALCSDLSDAILEATMDYDSLTDDAGEENAAAAAGIYKHLLAYPKELVSALHDLYVADDDKFHDLARSIEQREPASFVSNYIAVGDTLDIDPDYRDAMVRSLDYYQKLAEYGEIRTAGPEAKSKAVALVIVADAIHYQAQDDDYAEKFIERVDHETDFIAAPVIKHDSLIDFVLENHERASDIARVIKARNVFKPEEIRVVLEHPETPLADGAL